VQGVGGYALRADFGILNATQECVGIVEADGGYHFGMAGALRRDGVDRTVEHDFRKETMCLERDIRMARFSNDLLCVDKERWISILEAQLRLMKDGGCSGIVRFSQTSCYVDSVYAVRRKGTPLEVSDERVPLAQHHSNSRPPKYRKVTLHEIAGVSSDEESK
jgi:hypothetical protein